MVIYIYKREHKALTNRGFVKIWQGWLVGFWVVNFGAKYYGKANWFCSGHETRSRGNQDYTWHTSHSPTRAQGLVMTGSRITQAKKKKCHPAEAWCVCVYIWMYMIMPWWSQDSPRQGDKVTGCCCYCRPINLIDVIKSPKMGVNKSRFFFPWAKMATDMLSQSSWQGDKVTRIQGYHSFS